jgi:hypothetical protein
MSRYAFNIVRGHPLLNWLSCQAGHHVVPQHVAERLSRLGNIDQARRFFKTAKLDVSFSEGRTTESAFGVKLVPPEGALPYHGSQIVLPRISTPEVPFGSALMNCLIPKGLSVKEGRETFRQFQKALLILADELESGPFACITGYKEKHPGHILDNRGFRFFFSPKPDKIFNRIELILTMYQDLFQKSSQPPEEKIRNSDLMLQLQSKLTALRLATSPDGSPLRHPFLENIMPMAAETTLIDLR